MEIIRYNRQEFEASLVKGHDWKDRCEKVGNAVEEILEQSPVNKCYRAGAMTSAILKAYDIPRDRANPFHKIVSAVITQLGKDAVYRRFIHLGKEIRCGNKPDGSARWARERIWRMGDGVTSGDDLPLSDYLAPAEASAQPEHKADLDQPCNVIKPVLTLDEAKAALEANGYTVLEPGTVQGVDNPNISKHPSPGAARVDCGQCGGSGKVYMKQEPTT